MTAKLVYKNTYDIIAIDDAGEDIGPTRLVAETLEEALKLYLKIRPKGTAISSINENDDSVSVIVTE